MKQRATWLLVMALLLIGGVPLSMAEQIQLKQDGGGVTPLGGVDDAAKVSQAGLLACERNPSSATNSYCVMRNESNLSIISKTSAVTIGGGVASDTHLQKIQFQSALTGTCVLAGFADSDGTAQSITFAIGTVGPYEFLGAINSAGALTMTCSDAGDDNKAWMFWRPR